MIAVAVGIFGICQYAFNRRSSDRVMVEEKTQEPQVTSQTIQPDVTKEPATTPAVTMTTTPEKKTGDYSSDEFNIQLDINSEIIQTIGVSEEELAKQFRQYANECGYADADTVHSMDEMIIDYDREQITVACYFQIGKEKHKFDLLYYRKDKSFEFVPW